MDNKKFRTYGYDLLINNFEPFMRDFIVENFLIPNYGNEWRKRIPQGVFDEISDIKTDLDLNTITINQFFDEINFLHIKDIIIFNNNYAYFKQILGDLHKDKFTELMNELNISRRKIAHAKSSFSILELENIVENIQLILSGSEAQRIIKYIEIEGYKNDKEIPLSFFEEYDCQNNLPTEEYNIDGGFVGRDKEIKKLRNIILSNQDRINTITGAGGVGKTSIALRLAYVFINDPENPFDAIIWFSAKNNKLTEEGIVPLQSEIRNDEQLITDILSLIDNETCQKFINAKVPIASLTNHLYNIFSSQQCLLIIDNLETIIEDNSLIEFIKNIPRPSQILITSRKGLGEIERRFPTTDMELSDAIKLFRIIARERNRSDLLKLPVQRITDLVNKVKCYPLLIKWSIGQVCLGRDIESAFSQILEGDSEISIFSFNDVFSLLSENAITILFSMIILSDKGSSKYILMHLSNLTDDEFDEALKELIITSFVYSSTIERNERLETEYFMLSLTRGFVELKFDKDEKKKEMLQTRYHHLSEQIEELEKSQTQYSQSLFSLGIKTIDEKIAFNYVKTAKNYETKNNIKSADENYKEALKIAPNLSYILIEYSKFEFKRNHINNALLYAKTAIEKNPDSFHAWFNYGIMLRRTKDIKESLNCLIKAKELNPHYLPIYNELGRAYTIVGDLDTAEKEFKQALGNEKYPNYRHTAITLTFLADNYKRRAEEFGIRRDSDRQLQCLLEAYKIINQAIELSPQDKTSIHRYRDICLDFGVFLSKQKQFLKAREILQKCLNVNEYSTKSLKPSEDYIAEVYYYLSKSYFHDEESNQSDALTFIDKGLKYCRKESNLYGKLIGLKNKIESLNTKDKINGKIKFYNLTRKFGVIISEDESFIFFRNCFTRRMTDNSLKDVSESTVLFRYKIDNDKKIAYDIEFC